jgi:hypothetical protein
MAGGDRGQITSLPYQQQGRREHELMKLAEQKRSVCSHPLDLQLHTFGKRYQCVGHRFQLGIPTVSHPGVEWANDPPKSLSPTVAAYCRYIEERGPAIKQHTMDFIIIV